MKFKTNDEVYLKERTNVSDKVGKPNLWDHIDHWPLYVGTANLGRYMVISGDLSDERTAVYELSWNFSFKSLGYHPLIFWSSRIGKH